jgi:predicted Zn-dependent protease
VITSQEITAIKDKRHLEAADGWLGLGNWQEANEELNRISPDIQTHPDVLYVRWHICAKAGQWELAAETARALSQMMPDNPFGIIHFAYALHEMKRTKDAWDALLPMADRFPDNQTVPYNLAC